MDRQTAAIDSSSLGCLFPTLRLHRGPDADAPGRGCDGCEGFAPYDLLMYLGACQRLHGLSANSIAVLERGLVAKWLVQELLNWRLLSRHTRSPKACRPMVSVASLHVFLGDPGLKLSMCREVLIDHVAEMGRMDRLGKGCAK
ncbi:unnamed protein product [Symbiodinium sp. CCMP2592]|nr:unnamed protein product [Symbiodinium sp. CCMP2592]